MAVSTNWGLGALSATRLPWPFLVIKKVQGNLGLAGVLLFWVHIQCLCFLEAPMSFSFVVCICPVVYSTWQGPGREVAG